MERLLGDELRLADAAQHRKFGITLRCGASALTLAAASVATPAFAQQASAAAVTPVSYTLTQDATDGGGTAAADQGTQPAPDAQGGDNEVVVQGIRQSLRRSRDIKRDSDVVVDSITAEDISALPDRSVTEAIQRIPGVAIDRFSAGRDPDHFSTEGSGVVVRGLTYVRSELNGRDTFTANNGRGLSFSDVPSELLGGVDVFKSPSADMIEGGISGAVNLRTRLPFDNTGFVIAGSLEGNWGDMREEFSPSFSVFASNRWEGDWGELGVLASFSYSELKWRNDAVQISDFGRRTLYTNNDVRSTGGALPVGGSVCTTGAEASCVYMPRGAVMRTQDTDRERYGYSGAIQYRSPNRDVLATLQFLRSDSREAWTEHTVEVATDNVYNPTEGRDSHAVPGTTLSFDDDGLFDNGTITGPVGWRDDQNNTAAWGGNGDVRVPRFGLQSNNQRRDRKDRFITTDIGANVRWEINDHISLNLDYQHVDSSVDIQDNTLWTSSYQNAFIDLNGRRIPTIEFRPPEVCQGPSTNSPCVDTTGSNSPSDQDPSYFGTGHNSFSDPFNTFYRSAMDHLEDSDGNEDAVRADLEYRFPEESWIDSVRVGYRYATRENVARFSQYNWGVLSEIWGGRGPVWGDDPVDGNPNTNGGAPAGSLETFTFPGFMRGRAGDPQLGDPRLWYSGNTVRDFAAMTEFALRVGDEWRPRLANGCPQNWVPLAMRCGVIPGSAFRPGEVNEVSEDNNAAYAVVRFSNEWASGIRLSGNLGLRYTRTSREATGNSVFNLVTFTADYNPALDPAIDQSGTCGAPPPAPVPGGPPPQPPTPFCALPTAVRAQARAFANGAVTPSVIGINYDYFLPSLNLKLEVGGGVQFRFAFNKNITPPEFGYTRNFYNLTLAANAADIVAGGGLPVARATVGNPYLLPIRSTNFDFAVEWYFSDVGQLTFAAFYKRLHGVLTNDTARLPFTNNGATFDAIVTTPGNSTDTGTIKGFEIAYQQVYDFLPGILRGLGLNATYTFVDSGGVAQSTLSETDPDVAAGNQANVNMEFLPLQGLSRHTINFAPFYERGPFSLRVAYNWRSRFLLTTRDVIVPFSPIFNESTGQLDASIFYSINDKIRIGVQGVNLLNEVIRTSSVLSADANNIQTGPRSWFMNDRRFTFIVRARF